MYHGNAIDVKNIYVWYSVIYYKIVDLYITQRNPMKFNRIQNIFDNLNY